MYQNRSIRLEHHRQQTKMHADGSITVFVPVTFKRAGGRNFIISPSESVQQFATPKEHEPLVNALMRAFVWKEHIDNGIYGTVRDIAKKEKISETYVGKVYRLIFLAPDIIVAILDGKQPKYLTLTECTKPFPLEWEAQRIQFGFKVAEV